MNVIVGVAILYGAFFLAGIICSIFEERKIRKNRRAGIQTSGCQSRSRVVISQRVPSAMETLRGKPRSDPPPRRRR
jgi:hypothetical protein